jgi:hypothetical protein
MLSSKIAMAAFALGIALSSLASNALADPKADIAATTTAWAQAVADPDQVSSLYSDDAVLWGTAAPKIRSGRAAVRDYFVGVAKVAPGVKMDFGDQLIRVYGNAAVNSGSYTFSWVKDSERWLIVDHHSSGMPAPPK